MNELIGRIAIRLGLEEMHREHGHHLTRMGRVLVVGGIGFILQTIIFETLGIWWGIVSASTATLIGAECAILSNFTLNERFNFKDSTSQAPYWVRLGKFHLVSSGSLITQWTCVYIAESISSSVIVLNVAFLVGVTIGFAINYIGYYFFVWRGNN